jgi:hypothetical protein
MLLSPKRLAAHAGSPAGTDAGAHMMLALSGEKCTDSWT